MDETALRDVLLSGLLGALVGAVLGSLGSYLAQRTQTTRLIQADRDARIEVAERELELQRRLRREAVAAELARVLGEAERLTYWMPSAPRELTDVAELDQLCDAREPAIEHVVDDQPLPLAAGGLLRSVRRHRRS